MLALSHTLISAAIGDKVSNPALAFVLAFAMHFVCDSFLHWNFYPHKHKHIALLAAGDVVAGVIFSYLLLGARFWHASVLAAIVGGLLPDIIAFGAYFLKIQIPYFSKFHDGMQRETEVFWKGMISQVITIGIAILIILI